MRPLLLCLCLLPPVCLSATTPSSRIDQLAQSDEWLTLLHYQETTYSDADQSQADDAAFFLSPEGATNPKAELRATLEAIQQPGGGNDHARCRFPARDQWLRRQLNLPARPIDCPDYDTWRSELNTEAVTLVFAASYLNSPSSMFGHTFLRLDPDDTDEAADLLLADTISYAADAEAHDSELMFAYRGIFGGYPGITSVKPYYEKIRLYSDIENRDLWEYRLNLTDQEIDRMLAHAWELTGKNFDYYFFDENCAYRLLALIDVARPGTDLLDRVGTHAIPSDTVRWVVDENLVASVNYRPSSATEVRHAIDSLSETEQDHVLEMVEGDVMPAAPRVRELPARRRAEVLDTTYEYVQFRAREDEWRRERRATLSHALLSERSRIDAEAPRPTAPRPEVRDDQGHDTFRVGLGGGREGNRGFAQLSVRPAYHDLLDPPAGYRPGAQLQFLRLDARFYTGNQELQLEQLTAIEIRSLSVRDRFFSPLSWQVGVGGRRTDTRNGRRVLTPYLEGGVGGSWGQPGELQAFAMATADLEIDDDIARGHNLAPGADLGLLHQGRTVSLMAGLKTKAWLINSQHREDRAYTEVRWHLDRGLSLQARWEREDHFDRMETTWRTGLQLYF
ncbi:uncharacterized protein DUF4105 [Tamilnaduibacter salinus]|uniref:Uncharacterized protein DUF4105 n=1 Tax=Tamilnaduibacter salinus TaxID=1484056 RepID=A0A2U1CW13_9GAMM|nr:uncharacterized protein DUF4105 [Tamilnaduibacter salinus]